MRRSKRLAWFFTTPQCSSAVPPSKALADFQSSASEETATYFCPSPVPFNCQIIECIIRRWHAYRGNKHKDRYRKGSPSPPETITIGCHYNYPVSPTSSPRSSPLPDYKDASSQVAAKHDQCLPEYPPTYLKQSCVRHQPTTVTEHRTRANWPRRYKESRSGHCLSPLRRATRRILEYQRYSLPLKSDPKLSPRF